jgi:hypothetical protein
MQKAVSVPDVLSFSEVRKPAALGSGLITRI